MKVLISTKPVDMEKEQSEKKLSPQDFIALYNQNLPEKFPQATEQHLADFRSEHASLFKGRGNVWTLGTHRKKFMDWLSSHIREVSRQS